MDIDDLFGQMDKTHGGGNKRPAGRAEDLHQKKRPNPAGAPGPSESQKPPGSSYEQKPEAKPFPPSSASYMNPPHSQQPGSSSQQRRNWDESPFASRQQSPPQSQPGPPPGQSRRDWGKSPFASIEAQQPGPPPSTSHQQRNWGENPFASRQQQQQSQQSGPPPGRRNWDESPFANRGQQSQQQPPPQHDRRDYHSQGRDQGRDRGRDSYSQGRDSRREQPGGGYGGGHGGDRGGYRGGYQGGGHGSHQEKKPEGFHHGGEQKPFERYSTGGGDQTVREVEVQMNALQIRVQCEKVRRFHVTLMKTTKSGKQKDITKTPKNDQAAIVKENCVFAVMNTLIARNPDVFGHDRYQYVYDGGSTLYTCNSNVMEKEWILRKEDIATFPPVAAAGLGSFDTFVVSIKDTGDIKIKGCDPADPNREANKFFDVVLSAYAKEGNFLNYGQRSYGKEDDRDRSLDLKEGKIIKKGLEKSTKVISRDSGEATIHLQVSSRASAFRRSMPMLDFICEVLNDIRDPGRAIDLLRRDRGAVAKVNTEIRNTFVYTRHTNRYFSIKNLHPQSSREYKFQDTKQGIEVSVFDYFRSAYNIELKYPDAPLAAEVYSDKTSVHPLELLEIAVGQRIGTGRLGALAEKVHQQARSMPHDQKANVEKELKKIKLYHSDNPYLRAFNIHIDSDFVRTMAHVMTAPDRVGARNSRDKGLIFFQGADIERGRAVVVVLKRCLPEHKVKMFWDKLVDQGFRKGMRLPKQAQILFEHGYEDGLEKLFREWSSNRQTCPVIAFFLTKDKRDDIHHAIKYFEDRYGVQTQHVCVETVDKVAADRGGIVTIDNVLRKLNPKLGGVNDIVQGRNESKDFLADRMFIGLELSHPAAQTLYDRQFGNEVGTPTVVGMAYSLDRVEKLSGTFWFQHPRLTVIQNLEKYIGIALKVHQEQTKKLPRQLFVYRHGSSDGERQEVEGEIARIREVLKQMNCQISLVFVLCIAHSGTTLFPTRLPQPGARIKARDVNVESGTVLDTGIEKSGVLEFFIKSQQSNIGTSHMLRVLILANDPALELRELEKLTHHLAFAHQVCSMPTSKPAVLYAANELAKRGANHFKVDQQLNSDRSSHFDTNEGETPEDYYLRKSDEAQSRFRHHFWA